MQFLLASLLLFLAGGVVAFLASLAESKKNLPTLVGAGSCVAASILGLIPVASMLVNAVRGGSITPLTMTVCSLPMGECALRLDALSAVFLAPAFVLIAVAAIYGAGGGDGSQGGFSEEIILKPGQVCAVGGRHSHSGAHWLFYCLLAGGLVLTVVAADAFLFLLAWELMSVTPFFLITMNDDTAATREAAWIYLMAAHLGALVLLGFFALLAAKSGGSLSFADYFQNAGTLEGGLAGGTGLLFLLALIGFGAKAGFMPLHIWMPETYPATPSHIAAVMSGAMSKVGIYGLIRTMSFLGTGESWWSYTLIAIGAFSGLTGIIQAMAQPRLKRALAFSSVENVGIICMALGMGLFCVQRNLLDPAWLILAGALVHMVNHALTKGLLFLCAGSVLHGAGSGLINLLGGLQKRLPFVGCCFLIGAAAISALPPFNGFAGEFLIYVGMAFGGASSAAVVGPEFAFLFWFGIFVLAGIGGFTLLCFAKLYGLIFLGEPRSPLTTTITRPAPAEYAAIAIMAVFCLASAFAAPTVATGCRAAVTPVMAAGSGSGAVIAAAPSIPGLHGSAIPKPIAATPHMSPQGPEDTSAISILHKVNSTFLTAILFVAGLYLFRRLLTRGKEEAASPTWGCGYIRPSARIQYTGGSFSQPAAWFMRTLLRQKTGLPEIDAYFPKRAAATVRTGDWIKDKGFDALFSAVENLADKCKSLQHGRVNGYILYILITLVVLLAWKVR